MSTSGTNPALAGLLNDTTRVNLGSAWRERLEEAEILIQAGHLSMGVCLKAYAMEARIKLRICEHLQLDLLPSACKTHDLAQLIIFTGLVDELKDSSNSRVVKYWLLLVAFSRDKLNSMRYLPRSHLPLSDCQPLFVAFDDPNEGVFAWLSRPR